MIKFRINLFKKKLICPVCKECKKTDKVLVERPDGIGETWLICSDCRTRSIKEVQPKLYGRQSPFHPEFDPKNPHRL